MSKNNRRISKKKIRKFWNDAGLGEESKEAQATTTIASSNIGASGTSTVQLLEPQYDQGKENAELTQLTEEAKVKKILNDLVQKAGKMHTEYTESKKMIITTTAYHLEEYLKSTNRTKYICYISTILTHVLKSRVKGFITPQYMRRTLPERYMNPTQSKSGSQSWKNRPKSQTAGLPKDSGRTIEELKADLGEKHYDFNGLLEIFRSQAKGFCLTIHELQKQGELEGLDNKTITKRMDKIMNEELAETRKTIKEAKAKIKETEAELKELKAELNK